LFALQMALDQLWRSWGVEPDVVLGPGWGHYAAACAAGVMTWQDGLRLVAERERLEHGTPSAEASVVGEALEKFADELDYFPADRQLICNLSGDVVPEHQLLAGRYWRRHVTESLRIAAGVRSLVEADCDVVLEIGSRSALLELAGSNLPKTAPPCVPSLAREAGKSETDCTLQTLGQLYVGGVTPDFAAFDEPWRRAKIGLPTYPFERKRYWITDISEHRVTSVDGSEVVGKPR
jgi:acyl transferase domain-containing protein